MNMNQTVFAELLNVTFATVNRCENGRALPNKLAQDKIYDLCKEYDVSYDGSGSGDRGFKGNL